MNLNISKIIFLILITFLSAGAIYAQADASTNNGKPDPTQKMDLPDGMRENLAKKRVKEEEEQYQELIKRSEEVVKISEELNTTFEETQKLSNDDEKKIERLEKNVKKIRQDLGAADDSDDIQNNKPLSLIDSLKTIKDKSTDLLAELKKTSRYSVSVVAIESSNKLLQLVRFIKFTKN